MVYRSVFLHSTGAVVIHDFIAVVLGLVFVFGMIGLVLLYERSGKGS